MLFQGNMTTRVITNNILKWYKKFKDLLKSKYSIQLVTPPPQHTQRSWFSFTRLKHVKLLITLNSHFLRISVKIIFSKIPSALLNVAQQSAVISNVPPAPPPRCHQAAAHHLRGLVASPRPSASPLLLEPSTDSKP